MILRGRSSCTPILLQHKRVGSSVLWAPATASSVDFYLPELMNLGVIATIGKGERSREGL